MDAIAHARFQRSGTRKVGQVLKQIRGKSVLEVQQLLRLVPRACIPIVAKTVQSAAANLQVQAARKGMITDVIEPYLLKAGLLRRTPRGREVTRAAAEHLRLAVPSGLGGDLFAESV